MRMKKAMLGLVTVAMLVSPLGLAAAQAAPDAPRAVKAVQGPDSHGPLFCLPNVDNDNHVVCIADAPDERCVTVFQILIVSYWRCGVNNAPPTPGGCTNLDRDNNFFCLGRAKPSGQCRENIGILILHNYHCTTNGGRGGPLGL
jgi:hypothetical protein